MKGNKEDYYSLTDIVNSVRSFLGYLGKRWWLLLLVILAGAALGAAFYRLQQPKYKATTTFILEEKTSGGGIAGLASQFGLNIGSLSGGGSIFSGDNILNILKSKKVVNQVLLSKVNDANSHDKTLADLYLDFTGLKQSWQKKPIAVINFVNAGKKMSPIEDSVLNLIYTRIIEKNIVTERTSKQGTIIKVQVTAGDAVFARLLTERLVEEASKLYLDIRVGTAQQNIMQLQRRSDSLLALLNNKSYRAAASQLLDINPGMRTAIVPVEIANRDKTVIATLYAEVTKNLEASKLLLSQQTPVIQLLDYPEYLPDDHKKGLLFLIIAGSFAALFIYIGCAFLLFLFFGAGRKHVHEVI